MVTVGGMTTGMGAEDSQQKQFQVSPGGTLIIEADRGAIDLSTGPEDQVTVEVDRSVRSLFGSGGQGILDDHKITFEQEKAQVRIHAQYKKGLGWSKRAGKLRVKYTVTVPERFNVDLKTAGGSIRIPDLTGSARASTSGGNLSFGKIEGDVHARTSGGSISIRASGGEANIKTSGGNIELGEVHGTMLARTSGGSISADWIGGDADMHTSGGNIELSDCFGGVQAGTSGGSIDVSFSKSPTRNCSFKTSGGNIVLSFPAGAALDLDAATSGGKVTSECPVVSAAEGKPRTDRLQGAIHGGGPTVVARTSGGGIQIREK